MDDVKPPPKRFDDVARPGDTPASPSSIPVIVGNKTVQSDPMMTSIGSSALKNSQPTIPVQPPMSSRNTSDDFSDTEDVAVSAEADEIIEHSETPEISDTSKPDKEEPTSIEAVHKITHEKAFFGEMKPPMSRFKKVLIFILVIVITGAIGYGVWYFANKESAPEKPSNTPAPVAIETTKKDEVKIPANFTKYENKELGVSFSHPKEWGEPKSGNSDVNGTQDKDSAVYQFNFSDPKVDVTIIKSRESPGGEMVVQMDAT